jgi:glycerophosphoryl diester phosphodiesterase
LHLSPRQFLLGDLAEQVRDAAEARAPLIIRGHSVPGRILRVRGQVIDLARGRIKLNIELKFFGPDRRLARAVARLVGEQHLESDCIVTSFDYDALLEGKRENPHLRTGIIVGKALGDVSRLEVEALSVGADGLSDKMLRAAHRRGKEVHVWTVNDSRRMALLIKRGVDKVITDDPDLAIRVCDE